MVKKINHQNVSGKINLANILCIVLPTLLLVWKGDLLPPLAPLFYSRPWGQEQLAPSFYLFLLPLLSLVVFLLNQFMTKFLISKEEIFLILTVNSFSLLFSVLNTVAIFKIVFLII